MAPKVGELPADILKQIQDADLDNRGKGNASTPASQRVINYDLPLSDGPQKGEKGEYLPANYKTNRQIQRGDRDPVNAGIVRTDR